MEQNLQDLYNWIDMHEITRPKKNLNRDFSDAGMPKIDFFTVSLSRFFSTLSGNSQSPFSETGWTAQLRGQEFVYEKTRQLGHA